MRIGYIGLGNMGGPLARRLSLKYPLLVHDRSPAACAEMAERGTEIAPDAATLARECDVILLCLPTSQHVEALLFGEEGIAAEMRAGTLVIDQTSGDPVLSRSLAGRLSQGGVEMVDAPVSGGPEGANAGTIAMLVGGTAAQFDRVEPILSTISPNVIHAGAFGTGYVAKLANNLLFSAQRLMTFEVVALAAKNGLAPEKAVEILSKGSARNFFLEHTMAPRVLTGNLASGFTLGLAHKDVKLATELGIASDVTMIFGNLVREFYTMCINEIGRDAQVNEVARIVDRMSGTQVVPQTPAE
ncbi:NAD(P)-dependent oxidoreductase [Celeribacter indicus]|uniref:6-phosphogluconate dehydrogenase n=1 Tax=Celeribacter indicus TaxID=1208324 RepID=A0A0B5EA64_9RHOB|nr:NAD(P)-dependent oxidoreductase [Celeribacter indicus]AJE49177.1 6-phosphogluconate dehydrogenase [Celeribacter indicus]SDX18193.1 3-hydroxyisobutyrate dehydrogenase [Celeribacter indicus]